MGQSFNMPKKTSGDGKGVSGKDIISVDRSMQNDAENGAEMKRLKAKLYEASQDISRLYARRNLIIGLLKAIDGDALEDYLGIGELVSNKGVADDIAGYKDMLRSLRAEYYETKANGLQNDVLDFAERLDWFAKRVKARMIKEGKFLNRVNNAIYDYHGGSGMRTKILYSEEQLDMLFDSKKLEVIDGVMKKYGRRTMILQADLRMPKIRESVCSELYLKYMTFGSMYSRIDLRENEYQKISSTLQELISDANIEARDSAKPYLLKATYYTLGNGGILEIGVDCYPHEDYHEEIRAIVMDVSKKIKSALLRR
jgi:hypothetical protein